jgi:phage head maturation protease
MTIQRLYAGHLEQISEDEVAGVLISAGVKRDGAEWLPSGVALDEYRANPVVLRDHDPAKVIGCASAIGLVNGAIAIKIQFSAPGISAVADEARGLAKAGFLRGLSAGIDPIDVEPIDPRYPREGIRVLTSTLLEASLVAVPADQDALITTRALSSRPDVAAMLRSLPAISATAMERVLGRIGHETRQGPPSAQEQWAEDAARCIATYTLGLAARERDKADFAQRKADLRRLSGATLQ